MVLPSTHDLVYRNGARLQLLRGVHDEFLRQPVCFGVQREQLAATGCETRLE